MFHRPLLSFVHHRTVINLTRTTNTTTTTINLSSTRAMSTSTSSPLPSNPNPKPQQPAQPLIIILGSTGTGKSALAIHLATHLSQLQSQSQSKSNANPIKEAAAAAEIINADAMQLYTGLPIITNKLPISEQQGIPHHLLGTIGLDEETWTVGKYVREADRCIEGVRSRGRVPVVVGGTGYYVHGLVLGGMGLDGAGKDGVCEGEGEEAGGEGYGDDHDHDHDHDHNKTDSEMGYGDGDGVDGMEAKTQDLTILEAPTEEIYARLKQVDPVIARRWHPRDRRKIQRSLEIFLRTGRKASDVYAEQEAKKSVKHNDIHMVKGDKLQGQKEDSKSGGLRYPSLIFWLDAEDAALKARLNKRVDSMVENGLIEEAKQLDAFRREKENRNIAIDKSKGIWVSIGYKELEPWLEYIHTNDDVENSKNAITLQQSCIEAVKGGTRRYAKRQNRYIRIRLANSLIQANAFDNLFMLDCSNLDNWHEMVEKPAVKILDAFLQGNELPQAADLSELARKTFHNIEGDSDEVIVRSSRYCETCDKFLMTEKEWVGHLNSRSHKKILDGIRKRKADQEWLNRKNNAAGAVSHDDPT